MKSNKIILIQGGFTHYMSLIKESVSRNLDVNWLLPTHYEKYAPKEGPFRWEKEKVFNSNFAQNNHVSIRDERWVRSQKEGVFFTCEGQGKDILPTKNKAMEFYSLTVNTDYRFHYPKYISVIDWVIFMNKNHATYYKDCNLITKKNLYLGSPKYDIIIDPVVVRKNYGLPSGKLMALVFMPKVQYMDRVNVAKIISLLKKAGFFVMTKSRTKDKMSNIYGADWFLERSYYPHTSLDLISVANLVINFDSTAVEEVLMYEKPIINFSIKEDIKPLHFLYDGSCAVNMPKPFDYGFCEKKILEMSKTNFDSSFKTLKEKFLCESGASAKKIIDFVCRKESA